MTFLELAGWIFGALRSFDITVICLGRHPEGLGLPTVILLRLVLRNSNHCILTHVSCGFAL